METKSEERNWFQEIIRKQDKGRGLFWIKELGKGEKNQQENEGWEKKESKKVQTYLDGHSKDSKKINLVPENQPESPERQPADKKGLRASQLWKNRF